MRLPRPGRWLAAGIVFLITGLTLREALTNPRFGWTVVAENFFSEPILAGLWITVSLTAVSMSIAIVLGTAVAIMRLSDNPVLRWGGGAFVWLFRGVPLLVQLIFWYNLSALFPQISLGVPFVGPTFLTFDANLLINAYVASILGLSLNQAAYMAEIVRSGISSIDEGQLEAASAIGLTKWHTTRRILLPQAMRVIIPLTGNETISMFKATSLVSVVAVADLLYSTQLVYARTFQVIPMLIMASLWYLVLISILTFGQSWLEHHYSRGAKRHESRSLWSRLVSNPNSASSSQLSGRTTHHDS